MHLTNMVRSILIDLTLSFKRHDAKTGLELGAGGLYVHSDNDYEMTLHHQGDIRVRRNHDAFTKSRCWRFVESHKMVVR